MALEYSIEKNLGEQAPAFDLPGVDGKSYTLESFSEGKALLVVFICNHCPYVVATIDRLNALAKEYSNQGLQVVGISSNDVARYPADDFPKMKEFHKEHGLVFPYLFDETQKVAKDYGAACTPDPFLFNNAESEFSLAYQGRIDDNWKDPNQVRSKDLEDAIRRTLAGERVIQPFIPSMGCSIKWKEPSAN